MCVQDTDSAQDVLDSAKEFFGGGDRILRIGNYLFSPSDKITDHIAIKGQTLDVIPDPMSEESIW